MKILYQDENYKVQEMEVQALNALHGANIPNLQVLRSAAGYYIGNLCRADWCEEEFWEPYSRDSACYWAERVDAELALKMGDYPVKF